MPQRVAALNYPLQRMMCQSSFEKRIHLAFASKVVRSKRRYIQAESFPMYCIECATPLPDNAKFCSNCAAPQQSRTTQSESSTVAAAPAPVIEMLAPAKEVVLPPVTAQHAQKREQVFYEQRGGATVTSTR